MAVLRLDRWLTLWLFRIRRKRSLGVENGRLPILMYHSVSNYREETAHPYYKVVTTPGRFAEQMKWLAESGYRGVALEDALVAPPSQVGGQRLAAITFDDGFEDFYTQAWPVLERHGFTATVYLPTAFIGSPRKSFLGRACLSWDEVQELQGRGVRFGSHTVNHPKLYELGWGEIEDELSLSKRCLERQLGGEISSFAYPYAFPRENAGFASTLEQTLRRQGYRSCATTIVGCARPGEEPFLLPRLPINSEDDQSLFSAKLQGAYDWVSIGQSVFRKARALGRGRPAQFSSTIPPRAARTLHG